MGGGVNLHVISLISDNNWGEDPRSEGHFPNSRGQLGAGSGYGADVYVPPTTPAPVGHLALGTPRLVLVLSDLYFVTCALCLTLQFRPRNAPAPSAAAGGNAPQRPRQRRGEQKPTYGVAGEGWWVVGGWWVMGGGWLVTDGG